MAATTYTDQQQYVKFLTNQACADASPCDCNKSPCSCDDDCGCCPAGLVAVYDDQGHQISCLTPNDAELFQKNTLTCQDGYIKLIITSTGQFLGCVSEENFVTLNTAVNP